MTDWLMVIITAIYVVATIVICYFNGKSAKASKEQAEIAKKQTEEMIKQYNLSNRPLVTIRFDIIRSGLLCFVVENEGPLPAHDVRVTINEDFIDNLPDEGVKNSFRKLKESKLYIASHQKMTLLLDGQPAFSKIAEKVANIQIQYDGYVENTTIDISQYGLLMVYASAIEDISQNIKKNTEQSKKFYDAFLKKIPAQNHMYNVLMQNASDDDALKYRIYKEICINQGIQIKSLIERFDLEQDKILELLSELQKVDGWIQCLPSDSGQDELNFRCYKK